MRYLAAAVIAALAVWAGPARASVDAFQVLSHAQLKLEQARKAPASLLHESPVKAEQGKRLVADLDESEAVSIAGGGQGMANPNPVLAFILGFVPGFGLGHWIAGDPGFLTWTLLDVAFLAVVIVVQVLLAFTFFGWWLGYLVELLWWPLFHLYEGYSAYQYALAHGGGGPRIGMSESDLYGAACAAGAKSNGVTLLSFSF